MPARKKATTKPKATRKGAATPERSFGPQDFFTRNKANEGRKVQLSRPSGELSQHYIIMRGVDSDAFIFERSKQSREALRIGTIENADEREEASRLSRIAIIASLIGGWSFSDPELTDPENLMECTPENARNFLLNAPQIADMIEKLAGNRALFFGAL